MDNFKFSSAIYQAIVDGTQAGYLEYLQERKQKKKDMRVSGGYAWTKGNHIDHEVSKAVEALNINYLKDKAGYSWEYLQFTMTDDDKKYLFIIKNSKPTEKHFDGTQNQEKKDNYLSLLSSINTEEFEAMNMMFTPLPGQIELELNSYEEIKAVMNNTKLTAQGGYSRFYIVTYEINQDTKMIDSVRLTLPNSNNMELMIVDDLSQYIQTSSVDILPEDVRPILAEISEEGSLFSGAQHAFNYSVPSDEEKETEG